MALRDILMGGQGLGPLGGLAGGARRGGMSPIALAILGTLAYRAFKKKGGLPRMAGEGQGRLESLGGILPGGALSEGLSALLNRFKLNGQGEKAQSWIKDGPNTPIASHELEEALGGERMSWLLEQTGMSKAELLAGLSKTLPDAVDQLTPDGRLPTEAETQRLT